MSILQNPKLLFLGRIAQLCIAIAFFVLMCWSGAHRGWWNQLNGALAVGGTFCAPSLRKTLTFSPSNRLHFHIRHHCPRNLHSIPQQPLLLPRKSQLHRPHLSRSFHDIAMDRCCGHEFWTKGVSTRGFDFAVSTYSYLGYLCCFGDWGNVSIPADDVKGGFG